MSLIPLPHAIDLSSSPHVANLSFSPHGATQHITLALCPSTHFAYHFLDGLFQWLHGGCGFAAVRYFGLWVVNLNGFESMAKSMVVGLNRWLNWL